MKRSIVLSIFLCLGLARLVAQQGSFDKIIIKTAGQIELKPTASIKLDNYIFNGISNDPTLADANPLHLTTEFAVKGYVDNHVASLIQDADGDTKVQTEESADEDIIRFDVGGIEGMLLRKNASNIPRLEMANPGVNINTLIGINAGRSTTSGSGTAVGFEAYFANQDGVNNTAIGQYSLLSNTSGDQNVGVGLNSLRGNTTADQNTAVGTDALFTNQTSTGNAAVGYQALRVSTLGNNTGIGWNAGDAILTGFGNTVVGANAGGAFTTGDFNTIVGDSAYVSSSNLSNLVVLGYNAQPDASNQIRIGNTSSTQFWIGNYRYNIDQTVGAGQDNFVLTYDNGTGEIGLEAATGSGTVGPGTTNQIAKFIGPTTVDDSSVSDDGSVVTINVSGQTALVATGGLHAGISARSANASGYSHILLENSADGNHSYRLSRSADGNLDLIRSIDFPYATETDTIATYNFTTGVWDFKVTTVSNNGVPFGTGNGTVTSVGLALPNIFNVSGSPVTTSGTLTGTLASQSQNLVFASPNGSSGTPTFRALVAADIPDISGTYLPLAGGTMVGNILMTSNKLIGGSTTTSDLYLQTTTGVGATGADMHFLVGNNGATEAVTILNSGVVGIGTTSPDRLLHPELADATTNTVTYPLRISKITSGTATTNFGLGVEYELENGSGTNVIGAAEEITWSDATNGSEDATWRLRLILNGSLATAASVGSDGTLATAGTISAGTHVEAAAGSQLRWAGRSRMSSPVNGSWLITNSGATDFDRQMFGGTTASYPAWKRSGAGFRAMVADTSALTWVKGLINAYNSTTWNGSEKFVTEDAARDQFVVLESGTFWALDGQNITALKRMGSNDAFGVYFETNNTDRLKLTSGGAFYGGTLTDFAFTMSDSVLISGTTIDLAGSVKVTGSELVTGSVTATGLTSSAGRVQEAMGATVASANDMTLGADGNFFHISGNTTINGIASSGWQDGSMITLMFDALGPTTLTNAGSPGGGFLPFILLAATNFAATQNDTITLRKDTSAWVEVSRSVN